MTVNLPAPSPRSYDAFNEAQTRRLIEQRLRDMQAQIDRIEPGGDDLITIIRDIGTDATAVTSGTNKASFHMPCAMELMYARGTVVTPSSSGSVVFDINENGASIFGANKLTVDQGDTSSYLSSEPPDYDNITLSDDALITVDVDSAGTGAVGAKVWLVGRYTTEALSLSYTITDPMEVADSGSFSPTVSGGVYPFVLYAVTSGALPDGLTLDGTSGIISGTLTTEGEYTFTIAVTDSAGTVATFSDTVTVDAVPLTYSAWNPSDKSGSIDLSDSNRRASRNTSTPSANAMVRSVTSKNSGKWYVEEYMQYSPNFDCWGVAQSSTPLGPTSAPGIDANSWAVYSDTGEKYHNNILTTYGLPTKVGTQRRVMRAIDLDNGRMKFGSEITPGGGVYWGDGAGGGTTDFDAAPWAFTNLNGDIFLALSLHSSVEGSGTPFGSARTTYFDPAGYLYSPPTGFIAGWPD
jgi:hypothetical protein